MSNVPQVLYEYDTIGVSHNIYLVLIRSEVARDLLTSCVTSTIEYGETPLDDGSFICTSLVKK